MKKAFVKNYQKPVALVTLLKQRGMEIEDEKKAESYLKRIGYYRLSGYWYPFLQEPKSQHIFKPKSSFQGALSLYHFDRRLRLLVFNEIEKIEVAVRTAMVNILAEETKFGLNIPVFLSWTTVLANTRNTCCHHGRLWNRQFALRTLSIKGSGPVSKANQYRLYYRLCIIKTMLDVISPCNDMPHHLCELLAQYPNVDLTAMGFPSKWEAEALWRQNQIRRP